MNRHTRASKLVLLLLPLSLNSVNSAIRRVNMSDNVK